MTYLRYAGITVAIITGSYALAALIIGSPLAFGIALALCGAGWVAAYFAEWDMAGQRRRVRPGLRRPQFSTGVHYRYTART